MIEPMIEPIFVILGILASVAIPRLAATREDAEISAAVANLRTLVSDASAYYTVKGNFNGAKWNDITNVSLKIPTSNATGVATVAANLKVGSVDDCIFVRLVDKTGAGAGTTPAHIVIAKKNSATGVCGQVVAAAPVKAYLDSTVAGVVKNGKPVLGAIAIGSNTSVYSN